MDENKTKQKCSKTYIHLRKDDIIRRMRGISDERERGKNSGCCECHKKDVYMLLYSIV